MLVLLILVFTRAITSEQAQAETPSVNENPSTTSGYVSLTFSFPSPIATPAVLPDAPVLQTSQREVHATVIDKKFIVVMAALGGAEALRFTTHKLVLDNEFAAGAPWVQSLPANQHLVAKYAGIYAAELLVAYEIKKILVGVSRGDDGDSHQERCAQYWNPGASRMSTGVVRRAIARNASASAIQSEARDRHSRDTFSGE